MSGWSRIRGVLGLAVLCMALPTLGAKPNVIFFLVDDMGWMDSSVYGSRFYESPALERLAQSSVRFVNAYSASPLCSPSRASIMSGQYPARHGMTTAWGHLPIDPELPRYQEARASSPVLLPNSKRVLELEQYTMAESFHDAGYRTGFIGKWHLGVDEAYWPEHQGFEFTFHGAPDAGPPTYFSPYKFKAGSVTDGPEGEYLTDRATDEALKYIHQNDSRPFFLCLWQWAVHGPWYAKQEMIDYFTAHPDPTGLQKSPLMAAMLKSMDESLGRLLDDLEKSGLDKNTIIVFTSDNGGVVKKDIGTEKVPATSNAPLRNGKASLFEGGTRVPALIRWPGVTDAGRVEETPVTGVDYYPTLVEMCGIEPKQSQVIDGVSLVPLLKGGALERKALFCYFPHSFGKWSPSGAWVRQGDWKLIEVFDPSSDFPEPYELYNLHEDIGETRNLAKEYPERVAAMKAMLQQHYRDTEALMPIPNPGFKGSQPIAASKSERKASDVQGWVVSGPGKLAVLGNGALQVDARGIYTDKPPKAEGALKLRVRTKTAGAGLGSLFWAGADHKQFDADHKVGFGLVADGAGHEYEVEFTAADPLTRLRVDLGNNKKHPAEIEWIKLFNGDGSLLSQWIFAGDK
ncbi:MAG: sulfatase [Kiritimatiellales bacterium]|nr:sulfatase [Kiritimatiellales bacterium]MCF7863441.1 sulfatase [Kiritimatiellales bacterium]